MTSYRFCRPDDIPLLVEAVNSCYIPHFPDLTPITIPDFKRDIRELNVWCSSCMVAFNDQGSPIAVCIGAKRQKETLIYRLGVKKDYQEQGHARHILTSLAQKLTVLGPLRIVTEIPESNTDTIALFESLGYQKGVSFSDFVLENRPNQIPDLKGIEEIAAQDLLETIGTEKTDTSWERALDTIKNRKETIRGFTIVSPEQLEAYLLVWEAFKGSTEIVRLGGEDPAFLKILVTAVFSQHQNRVTIPKLSATEVPFDWVGSSGFRQHDVTLRYSRKLE